jgi:hypothetical protein
MRPELLHVVTCISNPVRWKSRVRLYHEFARHMLESGVHLTTVECAYGDRPFELDRDPWVHHVPVRAKTLVWTKENLLNLGVARLPQDWQYVAFIDADIFFRTPNWAAETVHALQQYDVVQPWSDCYDLGPDGEHMQLHRAFCRLWQDGRPIKPGQAGYQFGHPGYAWAFTRVALDQLGGLIETAALGAGDHHMAMALIDRVEETIPGYLAAGYRRPLEDWQERAAIFIKGNISYVPGTIEHGFHGSKQKRKYIDRWEILRRNAFDPSVDLKRNVWGVFELAGNKPTLRRDIDRYFRSRDEDSNTVE